MPAGKVCVLVGPSGCGKTTSLKMVNRLIEPTSGRILIDGVDAATRELTDLRRGIGYVIQQVGPLPAPVDRRQRGHRAAPAGLASKSRQHARADELLTLVGLDPARYGSRYPTQLSGGERQRVGVARALAADPPIMLMDEPFGAVDPIVRDRLQNEFLRLQEDLAKTILFVTHDIDEAIKMGDMVVVMQTGGHIAQMGAPAEILSHPASDFVARFVGADRGLKRLSLFRVDDITLETPLTMQPGQPVAEARRAMAAAATDALLLVDAGRRPIGWVMAHTLPPDGPIAAELAEPMSPAMDRRTTLKDALSMLLDADVRAGIVVDRNGVLRGLITVGAIMAWMRDEAARAAAERVTARADAGLASASAASVPAASASHQVSEPDAP